MQELARRSEVAWRLLGGPGGGPITVLAFVAAIETVKPFGRTRHRRLSGAHREARPVGETDIKMGIPKQGDSMARHYLYQAARVVLTTVKKRFLLQGWGSP